MHKTNRLLEQASELVSLEEFDEAFDIYNKILKKEPKNISVLIDKAVTLQRIGKNSQAFILFNRALKIETENIDALIGKGSILPVSYTHLTLPTNREV